MKMRPRLLDCCLLALALSSVMALVGLGAACAAADQDSQCVAVRTRWETLVQNLKDRLQELEEIQKTSLQKIIQRPLVQNPSGGKTIARQIAEAIEAKERFLAAKREECRSIVNAENQIFAEFEQCLQQSPAARKDDRVKKIEKQRRQLLDKAQIAITEIRAVEGQNTAIPYSQAYQGPYRPDGGYWQQYQQMYRGYWGQ
ncbi:MAG: hypothetical protein FJY85_16560 [Deltaproteobacteria bacterium]|nr:hypothetical protein [Deltaproteobacteria bacterium]